MEKRQDQPIDYTDECGVLKAIIEDNIGRKMTDEQFNRIIERMKAKATDKAQFDAQITALTDEILHFLMASDEARAAELDQPGPQVLTLQALKEMRPRTVIATGTANDDPQGLFMANTNRQLRWVAERGEYHDWAIYCHYAEYDVEYIRRHGDKVTREDHIRRCVPCDDEAFKMYRY